MPRLSRALAASALAAALLLPSTSLADKDDAPSAGAVVAAPVTQDTAKLTATVTLGKGPASYWFEYGTSPQLGRWTTLGVARHEDDDDAHRVPVTAALTGLAPGTPHYVRLVAWSKEGRDAGPIATFTTTAPALPARPPATPGAPAGPAGPAPGPADPAAPPAPAPALGRTVTAAPASGTVLARRPGGTAFEPLGDAASLPVGSVIDARHGALDLSSALAGGALQSGRFWGARFQVRQARRGNGRTDLFLRGSLAGCARSEDRAVASAAGKRKRVRRLWGKDDGGRFRTHGRDSVATVRGTEWSVTDRCDGTLTKVAEGAVDVRIRRTGRIVRVEAGEHHLARHRR